MGSSEGSVGCGKGSGGVATTLGTGLLVVMHAILVIVCTVLVIVHAVLVIVCAVLVIVHTVLVIVRAVLLTVLIAAYLFSHMAGVLSRV